MKAIPRQQNSFSKNFPSNPVHGVELDGFQDALRLVQALGTYASKNISPKRPMANGGAALPELAVDLATEALYVQSQLISQLGSGAIGKDPFSFIAADATSARMLQAATEVTPDEITRAQSPLFSFLRRVS